MDETSGLKNIDTYQKGYNTGESSLNPDTSSILHHKKKNDGFVLLIGISQIVFLVIFVFGSEYGHEAMSNIQYMFYKDVTIMLLVGFGFLMTFLGKYGLGSIGFTFFITCLIIQWGAICSAFFSMSYSHMAPPIPNTTGALSLEPYANGFDKKIQIDLTALLNGNFAAATALISFGALIGKIGLARMAFLAILEVPFFCLNRYFILPSIGATDIGGTIIIHLFGAYFGLAASRVFMRHDDLALKKNLDQHADAPTYQSDLFSLLGTIILWLYWPSFNGATAPGTTGAISAEIDGANQQLLITMNTILGLASCCVSSFVFSRIIGGKGKEFRPVDIQNATLAGGVAMGAASNLQLTPGGACVIGIFAALVSCYGFGHLQERLEKSIHLHDTCGIHNLHGLPAILGALVVTLATINISKEKYGNQYEHMFPRGPYQPIAQFFGGLATFLFSIVSGALSATVVKKLLPEAGEDMFMDHTFWDVATDYKKNA